MHGIDKKIQRILGTNRTISFNTPNNFINEARTKPQNNITKKSQNLLNLAKGSVFFPWTQPTVKSPTGKLIPGRMPDMNNVLKNFGMFDVNKNNKLQNFGMFGNIKKDKKGRNDRTEDIFRQTMIDETRRRDEGIKYPLRTKPSVLLTAQKSQQRPEYKEKRLQRRRTPEYKEKKREYDKDFYSFPLALERKREKTAIWRQTPQGQQKIKEHRQLTKLKEQEKEQIEEFVEGTEQIAIDKTSEERRIKNYNVKVVGRNALKNYGGMNYYAAKSLNFKPVPKKNEILIEKDESNFMESTILHEVMEANLMKKGMTWKNAHKQAVDAEIKAGFVPKKIILENNQELYKNIKSDKKSKEMVMLSKILPIDRSRQVERKSHSVMFVPQQKRVVYHDKPLHPAGTFGDLFKEGEKDLELRDRGDGGVLRTLEKEGDDIKITPAQGDPITVSASDELLYEPWMMDVGSIVFQPAQAPPGMQGQLLKLGTEADDISPKKEPQTDEESREREEDNREGDEKLFGDLDKIEAEAKEKEKKQEVVNNIPLQNNNILPTTQRGPIGEKEMKFGGTKDDPGEHQEKKWFYDKDKHMMIGYIKDIYPPQEQVDAIIMNKDMDDIAKQQAFTKINANKGQQSKAKLKINLRKQYKRY